MFGQSILYKYEASNCQQLFNLLHWNVMTNHKNDNIAQLFYSLPLVCQILMKLSPPATSSMANSFSYFSFFHSPYFFLSFCCCCCVYPNIKKVYIYIWQPDLICLFSASSGSQLKCKLTIIQIKPIIPF